MNAQLPANGTDFLGSPKGPSNADHRASFTPVWPSRFGSQYIVEVLEAWECSADYGNLLELQRRDDNNGSPILFALALRMSPNRCKACCSEIKHIVKRRSGYGNSFAMDMAAWCS